VAVVQALLAAYPEAAKATNKVRRPSPLAAWMRGPERSSEVIICNQGQSGVIIRNQRAISGTQRALSGIQSHSVATRWAPQRPSEVLSGHQRYSVAHQRYSEVLRGTQRSSETTQSHSKALSGIQRHSEARRGPSARGLHRPSPCVASKHLSSLLCSTHRTGTRPFTWPLCSAHRWRWCRRSSRRTRRPPRRRTRYAAPPPLPRG
jgi:hypothetical protein